jgi:hypothetical protein
MDRGTTLKSPLTLSIARLKRDVTRAETRFGLYAQRTSPFKSARWAGRQFSRLLAAEVCASAVVMLDIPCSEAACKTTGYPLHSHVSPSLPLPCVTVCHQVSTELYQEIVVSSCLTVSSGSWNIWTVYHAFATRYSWTYFILLFTLRFLKYVSCAWARNSRRQNGPALAYRGTYGAREMENTISLPLHKKGAS